MHAAPRIHALPEEDARRFLAAQRVGRIAYALHERVDIEPINFVFDGTWIFARTSAGSKLLTLSHRPWCAFEVDEWSDPFTWTSVVAHGSVHLLDPEMGSTSTYDRALAAVRDIIPETFSAADPAPHRTVLLGIFVQGITGRTSKPG